MAKHDTQFEATEGGLILTTAILIYQPEPGLAPPRNGATAFASVHPVEHHDGQPMIAAGTPLSRGHLRQWTEALGKNVAPEILPDNVLVAHADMIAWWVPAQVRPSYFALSRPPEGLKALAERTVLPLPYPAHLFVATRRGLGVYALRESERPAADTVVMHSPVLNVFLNGQLCWGNVRKPRALNVAAMPEFERAVFDSWSTQANQGQEATVTGKGGLVRLWDALAARRATSFPAERLVPFEPNGRRKGVDPITLGKLIAAGARA